MSQCKPTNIYLSFALVSWILAWTISVIKYLLIINHRYSYNKELDVNKVLLTYTGNIDKISFWLFKSLLESELSILSYFRLYFS